MDSTSCIGTSNDMILAESVRVSVRWIKLEFVPLFSKPSWNEIISSREIIE